MRIVLAGQAYFRPDNGQATFTVQLAHGLVRAGHEVLVLAPAPAGETAGRKELEGVQLHTFKAWHLPHNANITLGQRREMTRVVRSFNPHVVHIQDHYFLSRTAVSIAKQYNYRRLGTNHFLPENLADNFRIPRSLQPLAERLLWAQMLSVYRQLDAVTAPSHTAVKILQTQKLDLPLRAISCGVDLERFHPRNDFDWEAIRRKYGLDPNKTLFLYVGRVDREKDIQIIVRALAQLPRTDIQFGIAGKGSYMADLRQEIRHLGLDDGRVVLMGFVSDEDLPLLLNTADVFTMPSPAELLSIASLEAMASGLPVLAANAQALPELVEHQVNGYLFTPGDPTSAAAGLAWLGDRPDNWMALRMTSIKRAYAHSLEQIVAQYVQWYTEQHFNHAAHPAGALQMN
jgi:1,2-diacylglycerol 3-alpha-glucosyltransferase